MKDYVSPIQGLATTNNDLFIRNWYEVDLYRTGFGCDQETAKESQFKWFPVNKGGGFRKWYGNNNCVLNYENNGKTLCDYIDNTPGVRVKSNGRIINKDKYFLKGITWGKISSGDLSVRMDFGGFIPSDAGMKIYSNHDNRLYMSLSLMNSKVCKYLIKCLSETVNFEQGTISKIPVISSINTNINSLVDLSKIDWDSHETSWDFNDYL